MDVVFKFLHDMETVFKCLHCPPRIDLQLLPDRLDRPKVSLLAVRDEASLDE